MLLAASKNILSFVLTKPSS